MRLDHLSYAAGPEGLGATAQRLGAALGAGFRDGGLHPRFGTRNFVLPLANGVYLEVVTALDHPAADKAPFGQAVKARTEAGGGWLAWVVAVDDLAPIEQRLGRSAVDGHRRRPDGVDLTWRQIGVLDLLDDPALPFFIQWLGDPALHPAPWCPTTRRRRASPRWRSAATPARSATGSASRWPGPTSGSTGSTTTTRAGRGALQHRARRRPHRLSLPSDRNSVAAHRSRDLGSSVVSGTYDGSVALRSVGFAHGPHAVLSDVTVTVGPGSPAGRRRTQRRRQVDAARPGRRRARRRRRAR